MFVRRSTYEAMRRMRDDEAENGQRWQETALATALDLADARTELAASWHRNERGHLVRHPSYVAPEGAK